MPFSISTETPQLHATQNLLKIFAASIYNAWTDLKNLMGNVRNSSLSLTFSQITLSHTYGRKLRAK
jgi:hypothetical protein